MSKNLKPCPDCSAPTDDFAVLASTKWGIL